MAVKTITITEDAYYAMKRMKREGESFSQLFMRLGCNTKIDDIAGALKDDISLKQFRKRIENVRSGMSENMNKRISDVRSRLKRVN